MKGAQTLSLGEQLPELFCEQPQKQEAARAFNWAAPQKSTYSWNLYLKMNWL